MSIDGYIAAADGGDVWLAGGASAARAFLDAERVDRLELYVIPTLLGSGIRLFAGSRQRAAAALRETATLDRGVVKLVYDLRG